MKIIKRFLIILIILAASALLAFLYNENANNNVVLTEYKFSHEDIPASFNGFKIMLISDLHEADFAEQILHRIYIEKPDVIAITGDMVQLPGNSISQVKKIAAGVEDVPIYAVSGNHDRQCGRYYEIVEELKDVGIIPLENDKISISRENELIHFIGIKDPEHDEIDKEHIDKIQKNIKERLPEDDEFSVLLFHRANLYPEIKNTGVDLMLSGHLHGGIVRMPLIGGMIGPERTEGFNRKYGMIKDSTAASVIISGGCDKNPAKKRYFNPPEVVLITLEGE